MFCPQCRAVYREGFTRCVDCDVTLVTGQEREEPPEQQSPEESFVVWSGSDPVALSNMRKVLEKTKLEFRVEVAGERSGPEMELRLPSYEVLVSHSDHKKAVALIERIEELLPLISGVKGEPVVPGRQRVAQPHWMEPLAWFLVVACYSVSLALIDPLRSAAGFLLLFPMLGALWMIYHAIGREKPSGKYVLAALGVPFAFVFYFAARLGRRRNASALPSAGADPSAS